jgi:hypothetical protein
VIIPALTWPDFGASLDRLGFSNDWQVPMNVSVITDLDDPKTTALPTKLDEGSKRPSHLKMIEFELALGAEDLRANGFEACLDNAAQSAGFQLLFNIPSLPEHDWQRLAAVATVEDGIPMFVYVALSNAGDHAEIEPDLSSSPHLQQFAEAYFELMICQSSACEAMAD